MWQVLQDHKRDRQVRSLQQAHEDLVVNRIYSPYN